MRPVVDIVDQLLSAGVNVTVYNGQLDLIVDTMGNWLALLASIQQDVNPRPALNISLCHRSGAVGEATEVGGSAWIQPAEVDRPG